MSALRAVRWSFAVGPVYRGWTDGTTWNGFANVLVDAATHAEVIADIEADVAAGGDDGSSLAELRSMVPDADGRVSYGNGYATELVEEYASIDDAPLCECGEYRMAESDDEGLTYYEILDGFDSTGTDSEMTWHTHTRCSKGKRS